MKRNETLSNKQLKDILARFRAAPGRDPRVAASARADFLRQVQVLGAAVPRRPASVCIALPKKRGLPVWKALLASFLALAVLFAGTATTVYAAQDSLPDQTLYPLKTFSEDALLALAPSQQERLSLTLDFTDRRLAEIASLQSAGHPIPQKAIDRFRDELDRALELASGMTDPVMVQSLDKVSQRTQGQLRAMDMLMNDNPGIPTLMGIQARLQEQAQVVKLGKDDPQGFRQLIQGQLQNGGGKTSSDQNGPGKPKSTPIASDEDRNPGSGRTGKTGAPDNHDDGNNPPIKTPKSPGHHGPGSTQATRTPDGDHHHWP
jgi:hypothetical protein